MNFGDEVLATVVQISHADALFPQQQRWLYKDDIGNKLIVRTELSESGNSDSVSLQDVASGESVKFGIDAGVSLTVTVGAQEHTVLMSEVVAFSGENGRELPPTSQSATTAMIGSVSASFRAALRRLTEIGCDYSVELQRAAVLLRTSFFSDVVCDLPTLGDATSAPKSPVRPFDPSQVPPSAFEQEFGSAYYQ